MDRIISTLKYIRERPAVIILTACAFTFFFAAIYFALTLMVAVAYRDTAACVAAVASALITGWIVIRHRDEA